MAGDQLAVLACLVCIKPWASALGNRGMVVHAYNTNTWEVDAGVPGVWCYLFKYS